MIQNLLSYLFFFGYFYFINQTKPHLTFTMTLFLLQRTLLMLILCYVVRYTTTWTISHLHNKKANIRYHFAPPPWPLLNHYFFCCVSLFFACSVLFFSYYLYYCVYCVKIIFFILALAWPKKQRSILTRENFLRVFFLLISSFGIIVSRMYHHHLLCTDFLMPIFVFVFIRSREK